MVDRVVQTLTTPKFPVAEVSVASPIIGNPVLYDEITTAIQAHGDNATSIEIKTSFQETRFPITSRLFKDLKLNKDPQS